MTKENKPKINNSHPNTISTSKKCKKESPI